MGKKNFGSDFLKFLPEDLKNEYSYLTRTYPDIEGLNSPFLNLSDAFRAYFILIHYFTDTSTDEEKESMMVGIRSVDLLASALGRQNISFAGKRKYSSPIDVCSTLFFGIVKNHSFNDGNKRTALLLLLYQLQLYGYFPTAPKKDFENLVLHVADSSVDQYYHKVFKKYRKEDDAIIKTISHLLRNMTTKKDNTYHTSPTMREFCDALEQNKVKVKTENDKVKFTYAPSGQWRLFKSREKSFTIPFHGWTRVVGAKTARETLRKIGLYEEIPSYKYLLDGKEPLYQLVDEFKEPLRRLKDK